MLTPKQLLQRLLVALAQLKAGNNSESLFFFINQKTSLKKNTTT